MSRALVLNASFEPLCVVPSRRALVLVMALHIIQRSATVLLDRQGVIRYLHRATLPGEALNWAAVLAALAQVHAQSVAEGGSSEAFASARR